MKFILAGLCLVILSACAVIPPQVQSIIVDDQVVGEAGNDVQLLRAGAPIRLAPGTTLEPGDEIITGPGAQAVLLLENGRIEVIVFENSEVTYSSLFLKLGEVYVRVKKSVQDWFVDSEYVAAMPTETGYIVRIGSNGEYVCEVLEGRVTARSKGGSWQPVSITSGERVSGQPRAGVSRQTLSKIEYNKLVDRINTIERVYRPAASELMVPDVVELTEADAQKVLLEHGFSRGKVVGVVRKNRSIGEVDSQLPLPGTRIRPGSTVQLMVEVEPTSVPNVVGSDLVEARRLLERAKLELGSIQEQLEVGVESDIVRSQSEAAGKDVAPGTKVDVVVTEKGARVPSLNGLSLTEARRILAGADLQLGDDSTRTSTRPVNTIIEQDPSAGDIARVNSDVDVVLAEKEIRYCTVPNVSGMTPADARAGIKAAGFEVDSKGSGNLVWGQRPTDPTAGMRIPFDSTVTINMVEG
jgi:beta-lactam-binding protein with PASTA domain